MIVTLRALATTSQHNNNIKYISQEALTPLRLLEKLRIDTNNMQYAPAGVFANFQYLVAIKLDKNPWHCDCSVLYLARWVYEFPLMRYDDLCDGQWASMMSLSPRLPVRKNRITTPMNYSDYFNRYLKHIYTEAPPNLLAKSSSENETVIP